MNEVELGSPPSSPESVRGIALKVIKKPIRFGIDEIISYCLVQSGEGPSTHQEAMNSPEAENWKGAMESEMASLEKNKTWTLVADPPKSHVLIIGLQVGLYT